MSYINNVFRLSRELNKKYRLNSTTIDLDESDDDNKQSQPPAKSPAKSPAKPPAPVPASQAAKTPQAQVAASTKPAIAPVTSQVPKPDNDPPQPKATSKDSFLKTAINKGIGRVLATKNAISNVADDYAKRRMNTFLYFGGGFSPAMREKVMKESDKAFHKFIEQAHLKGKGFSLFGDDYAKLHTIFDKLHATKLTGEARQHALQEMFKAHTKDGGHFSHHNIDDLIKEANRLHSKNSKSRKPGQESLTPDEVVQNPAQMTN